LISFIAVMSMRYSLNKGHVREVCRFLKQHTLEQLNAELQAGRTFVLVPTNQGPRFVSQGLGLMGLRELCGNHGYPGLLLDIASFVEDVNGRIRESEDACRSDTSG